MQRKLSTVWSAHTYKDCNSSEKVYIRYAGKIIGETVFNPMASQPRAYVKFDGTVVTEDGKTIIDIE